MLVFSDHIQKCLHINMFVNAATEMWVSPGVCVCVYASMCVIATAVLSGERTLQECCLWQRHRYSKKHMLQFYHSSTLTKHTQRASSDKVEWLLSWHFLIHICTHTLSHTLLHLSVVHYLSAAVFLFLKVFTTGNTLGVKNAKLEKWIFLQINMHITAPTGIIRIAVLVLGNTNWDGPLSPNIDIIRNVSFKANSLH